MEELYDVLIAGKMGSKAGFKPTEEQLEAMNSGINAEKVAQIETNEDNISVLQNNVENVDEKVANVSDVVGAIIAHGTQSWDTVQAIVRSGLAPEYYPVGTILYDNWDETTGTAFRVVGYDVYFDDTLTAQGYTHSMLLYETLLRLGCTQSRLSRQVHIVLLYLTMIRRMAVIKRISLHQQLTCL